MENKVNYLESVLDKYKVNNFPILKAEAKAKALLTKWMGTQVHKVIQMGGTKQGTSIFKGKNEIDLDLLVVFGYDTTYSLAEIHSSLYEFLEAENLKPLKRNISIRIELEGTSIDFAPAIEQPGSDNYVVWSRKLKEEFQSNPEFHIEMVKQSKQQNVIKLVKLWAYLNNLEFESFYIVLVALNVLQNSLETDLYKNFVTVMEYLSVRFIYDSYTDPIEPKDRISDHITDSDKKKIARAAEEALQRPIEEVLY